MDSIQQTTLKEAVLGTAKLFLYEEGKEFQLGYVLDPAGRWIAVLAAVVTEPPRKVEPFAPRVEALGRPTKSLEFMVVRSASGATTEMALTNLLCELGRSLHAAHGGQAFLPGTVCRRAMAVDHVVVERVQRL